MCQAASFNYLDLAETPSFDLNTIKFRIEKLEEEERQFKVPMYVDQKLKSHVNFDT